MGGEGEGAVGGEGEDAVWAQTVAQSRNTLESDPMGLPPAPRPQVGVRVRVKKVGVRVVGGKGRCSRRLRAQAQA